MIPEAPFLFSIAGLSASLAGLAGLVAGLRRGADVRPMDLFRLRQIVEFAFANMLLALALVPLAVALERTDNAVRIMGAIGLSYAIATAIILAERLRHWQILWTRGWRIAATILNLGLLVAGLASILTGAIPAYEFMLIIFLARPMVAFVLVLGSLQGVGGAAPGTAPSETVDPTASPQP